MNAKPIPLYQVIELAKPTRGPFVSSDPRAARVPGKGEVFDRGERVILVDGVRWGRTVVAWNGPHGNTTTFVQAYGGEIGETSERGRFMATKVHSVGRRNRFESKHERSKTTEEIVLDTIRELITAGKLRHPDVVKKEVEARNKRDADRHARAREAEALRFRSRAIDALGLPADRLFTVTEENAIEAVVAAMRWAQGQ